MLNSSSAFTSTSYRDAQTLFLKAAQKNRLLVVKLLLDKGVDIETKDTRGRTTLFLAAWNKELAMVELLLERGAEVQFQDKHGRTLFFAAPCRHMEAAELLLKRYYVWKCGYSSKDDSYCLRFTSTKKRGQGNKSAHCRESVRKWKHGGKYVN